MDPAAPGISWKTDPRCVQDQLEQVEVEDTSAHILGDLCKSRLSSPLDEWVELHQRAGNLYLAGLKLDVVRPGGGGLHAEGTKFFLGTQLSSYGIGGAC
jgi:hypothetical protein